VTRFRSTFSFKDVDNWASHIVKHRQGNGSSPVNKTAKVSRNHSPNLNFECTRYVSGVRRSLVNKSSNTKLYLNDYSK